MYLADEAWPDLEAYFDEESLALLPLGSTEQHGPHLPEGTDHLIAEAFARAAAERTGYLCTPTIPVGVSPHHKQFSGTLWADAEPFRNYVESITRNLAYHGVDRVIYVNAHGGNTNHLREVGRRVRDDGTMYAIEWMWNDSIPEMVDEAFEYNGPHGGPKETALIQYLHRDLVHDERLAGARDEGLVHWQDSGRYKGGSRTVYDFVEFTDNGVLGDQTDATAAKGEELFEAATGKLCELAEWLADRDWEELRVPDRR